MIYLDYAATTPCDPRVVEAMLPFFSEQFGNASSIDHSMGVQARKAVDQARASIASLVGAKDEDVIFTSGSTEANNLVLAGTRRFAITSMVEHPSVLESVTKRRDRKAYSVLPVNGDGVVTTDSLRAELEGHAGSLVSIISVNNEIGCKNDIGKLSQVSHEHGAFFHSDMTQAFVASHVDFRKSDLDAISMSAHKIYGPKGVGALICKAGLRRETIALAFGGGHERGLRSGTLNVPGIVGFGAAASILEKERGRLARHLVDVRTKFTDVLGNRFSGNLSLNGGKDASPHILSVTLHGVNNRALLRMSGDRLCFSLGSACATNKNEPSHVLKALGLSDRVCNETIRVSFGLGTTNDEATEAATLLASAANGLLELVA